MNEQRAREGVEHLQVAALEVIAAVRAFLDIAEDVVRDPAQVTGLVQDLADLGRTAARAGTPGARGASGSAAGTGAGGGETDSGVTRIRVS